MKTNGCVVGGEKYCESYSSTRANVASGQIRKENVRMTRADPCAVLHARLTRAGYVDAQTAP